MSEGGRMPSGRVDIAQARSGRTCVMTLSGRIDNTNTADLLAQLKALIASGEKSILLDLGAVLYLTSAAFRALLIASKEAERNAAHLALCSVKGQVRDLFEMAGLLDALTILGSREEALARLG
jgi:anti-anti-sigma factor